MDLLKEQERLTKKHDKAFENLGRKQKYLKSAGTSCRKAKKEFNAARHELRAIRRQIKAQGVEDLTIPETIDEQIIINSPIVKPVPTKKNMD